MARVVPILLTHPVSLLLEYRRALCTHGVHTAVWWVSAGDLCERQSVFFMTGIPYNSGVRIVGAQYVKL